MTLALGSDHGGFGLKETIKQHLDARGFAYRDFGTCSTESVDYPDFAAAVAKAVASGECEQGIIICGTGVGISIAANKVKGIRAALCHDVFSAKMSREHNDANILALGERVVGPGLALMIVDTWLTAEFAGGRHEQRVKKITALEQE
jgi:ribose 5-phosphate isomerase B